MHPSISYVDDLGNAYYISLWAAGNYTYDVLHWTDSSFQVGDKQFYYNSTIQNSTCINEISDIINRTEFHKHDWVFWNTTQLHGYSIEEVRIIRLNATYLHELNDTIKGSGFIRYRHDYNSYFHGAGGAEFEMTIPRHHKSIIADYGAEPKGLEDIWLMVKRIFFPNYPYYSP